MTQEEKAKAYDEALEKAKELLDSPRTCFDIEQLKDIFSELAESEGEKTRKELLEEIESIIPHEDETDSEGLILPSYHTRIDRYKSYLEKQKEQKVDIDKIRKDLYQSGYNDGYQHGKEDAQKEQKPADIVKPKFKVGDTIVSKDCQYEDEVIAIQNGAYKLKNLGELYLPEDEWELKDAPISGYELIDKMEHKSINRNELTWKDINELEEIMNEVRSDYRGGGIGQKNFGLEVLERFHYIKGDELDIKEQKPAEWSDEDERKYQCIRNILLTDMDKKVGSWKYSEILEWYEKRGIGRYTNSKPRWKPTDKQMETLRLSFEEAFDDAGDCNRYRDLKSLYEQLKKLI